MTRAVLQGIQPNSMSFGFRTMVWASLMPLLHRLGRGEGLLVAVNLSIVLTSRPDIVVLLAHGFVSTWVLTLLYMLNDVFDCRRDVNDPGKNQAFVGFCVEHRSTLLALVAAQKIAVLVAGYALLGPRSAIAIAAVFLVNLGYSAFFKGVGIIDVPYVALWGALYAMVPGVDVPLAVLGMVGVMTSICHVFQISRDKEIDTANQVQTSAAISAPVVEIQMWVLCLTMGGLLYLLLGPIAALSALIPLALGRLLRFSERAWMASKLYFGVAWVLVLWTIYAP